MKVEKHSHAFAEILHWSLKLTSCQASAKDALAQWLKLDLVAEDESGDSKAMK